MNHNRKNRYTQPILELNGNRNSVIINFRCEWTLSLNNLFISVICDKIFNMFLKESTELQNIQNSMCDAGCFILIRREFVRYVAFLSSAVADLGGQRDERRPQPTFFIFMQFLAKIIPNNRLAPPKVGAPSLENPGSATVNL